MEHPPFPILFLDDELKTVQPLLQALGRRGFEIEAVATPEEAFALVAQKRFCVAVSDERMPTISGIDFLSELARRHPHVVRVLFTAYTDHATAVNAINSGNIFRYILKTQTINDIARILTEAIDHFRKGEQAQEAAARVRHLDRAEGALTVLRDVRYDWGNIVLAQKLQFKKLQELLAGVEQRYSLDLNTLKQKCEDANRQVEASIEEYFHNPFFDSTLTETEAFVDESPLLPVQMALHKVRTRTDPNKITFHLESGLAANTTIPLQRERLKAAIGLILLNAVEGIADKGEIHISLTKSGEATVIEIRDTGKGIPPDMLEHVFEPLVKSMDKQGHMGIGLTFAKAIVEDHSGMIGIDSKQGEGTRVKIQFPTTK